MVAWKYTKHLEAGDQEDTFTVLDAAIDAAIDAVLVEGHWHGVCGFPGFPHGGQPLVIANAVAHPTGAPFRVPE